MHRFVFAFYHQLLHFHVTISTVSNAQTVLTILVLDSGFAHYTRMLHPPFSFHALSPTTHSISVSPVLTCPSLSRIDLYHTTKGMIAQQPLPSTVQLKKLRNNYHHSQLHYRIVHSTSLLILSEP